MVKFALTFDYELFFNKQYASDSQVLIEPTYKIMDLLLDNNISCTFFIDTCMIQKISESDNNPIYEQITQQIHDMHKASMEVGLHMHPIWLSAMISNEHWIFNPKDYTLSEFDEKTIEDSVNFGISFLNKIAKQEDKDPCISFRAGGFCFEPPRLLYDLLYTNGIRIDSSVYRHAYKYSYNQKYDYKNTPKKNWWNIKDGNLCKDVGVADHCTMIEIPITSSRSIPFKWIVNKKYPRISCKPKGESSELLYKKKVYRLLERQLKRFNGPVGLSIDKLDYHAGCELVKKYIKEIGEENSYIVLLGHPKFQDDITIANLHHLIDEFEKNFNCEFMTLRGMYEEIVTNRG